MSMSNFFPVLSLMAKVSHPAEVRHKEFLLGLADFCLVKDAACGSPGHYQLAPLLLGDEYQDFAFTAGVRLPFFRNLLGVFCSDALPDVVQQHGIDADSRLVRDFVRDPVKKFKLLRRD